MYVCMLDASVDMPCDTTGMWAVVPPSLVPLRKALIHSNKGEEQGRDDRNEKTVGVSSTSE